MAKKKYFYNPETCQYEPVKVKRSDVVAGLSAFLVVVLILAVGITLVFNTYYDTEREASLKKENRELENYLATIKEGQEEIDQMIQVLHQRDNKIYNTIYEGVDQSQTLIPQGILGNLEEKISEQGFKNPDIISEFKQKIEKLKNAALEDLPELTDLANNKRTEALDFMYIPTIQPIQNSNLTALASGFGKRMNPFHHGIMDHNGIDFAAPKGTQVLATAHGTVKNVIITDSKTGYGNRIEIDHGNGLISRFAHLDQINVKKGQKVERGETIGTVGNTGGVIAPCVHYEIIRNGKQVNPINFFIQEITEKDYLILLELALRENQSLD